MSKDTVLAPPGLHADRTKWSVTEREFAQAWVRMHQKGHDATAEIVGEDLIGPRARVVAATLIQWLGAPVGEDFLDEVQERARGKDQSMAYAQVWQEMNSRYNADAYLLAVLLTPLNRPGSCSARDVRVARRVIGWLGTPKGRRFVTRAQGLAHARRAFALVREA